MNCLIISGGSFSKIKFDKKYDLVIACDKGYTYASRLGVQVDLIVGDFDSAKMPSKSANVIAVSSIKDDTDTALAVKYALRNGYKNIDIVCALGKRLDHVVANISLLKYIITNGAVGRILSSDTEIKIFGKGKFKIKKQKFNYFSLFSFDNISRIEYIKGSKYDVKNIALKNDFPLGISNEFVKNSVEISVKSGIILVFLYKKA